MQTTKFGTVLGLAPGGVPVYSSDYATADSTEFPNRKAYRSFVDGIFMGYKWQCVEFVRRWLYINKQYLFDDIPMAYDIFRLRSVRKIGDNSLLPLHSFKNGSCRRPEPGCLLIFAPIGEFSITGHVAIVTEVHDTYLRFADQNDDNLTWPKGQNFSRQLKATLTEKGGYNLEAGADDVVILGWVIQTDDGTDAEDIDEIDTKIFRPLMDTVADNGQADAAWIDTSDPAGAAYAASAGHTLVGDVGNAYSYFSLSESAYSQLQRATNELHHFFMRATEYVVRDAQLLHHFHIPMALWPRIRSSWDHRKNSMITGRFDFSISEKGIKVYEYNADSASCYFEAARLQTEWADHFGCSIGRSPGEHIFSSLVTAWKSRGIKDILHIMQDFDDEETYHALFMKEAMERAGIVVKILKGVTDLHWRGDTIVDADNIPIKRVWKTWAWETALDQIRDEIEDHQPAKTAADAGSPPRLVDVLLRRGVMVHEPLWTLIPSNKAILPVIWSLFPDHPYLLESQFELTENLLRGGYVEKPIVGRSGENIVISDTDDIIGRTEGRFGDRQRIYQNLFRLPQVGDMNVQVCSFAVAGSFAGACVRVDPSLVIRGASDVMPLRIIADDQYRRLKQQEDSR